MQQNRSQLPQTFLSALKRSQGLIGPQLRVKFHFRAPSMGEGENAKKHFKV
jgi:hypothetical protein